MMHSIAIWAICTFSIAGVLTKPRGLPEWVWATVGALALAVFGLLPPAVVMQAIDRGTDVYLFLTGMMLLAELARRKGVFDWVASHAVRSARNSRFRLLCLVYGAGTIVTVILSNDATAVVMTPAIAAAMRHAKIEPLPHLLACALVANAASFVLPISNPANLVLFAGAMPNLQAWFGLFALPSLLAIAATFAVLALISRRDLRGPMESNVAISELKSGGNVVLAGIGVTAAALLTASAFAAPLGATTCICGVFTLVISAVKDRAAFRDAVTSVSWTVLILVAGLFVLVQGLESTSFLHVTRDIVATLASWSPLSAVLSAAVITSLAGNLINNLPAGLIAGASVAGLHGHQALRAAIAIGIDLGPNLSVTGSLATVLWLLALRRENIEVSAWTFFRAGSLVMPPALILSVVSLLRTKQ